MADVWEIYEDRAGGWRWRRTAANGRIIATSGEGYTRHWSARRAMRRPKRRG